MDVKLWAPLEVSDFDAAFTFYSTVLGLPVLDSWRRDGERGAVFGAGPSGRIEIVATGSPTSPPSRALELPTWTDVDDLRTRMLAELARQTPAAAPPHGAIARQLPGVAEVFPRGHYGFVARDPDGNPLLVWSEKT